jgi:hypothetical protein
MAEVEITHLGRAGVVPELPPTPAEPRRVPTHDDLADQLAQIRDELAVNRRLIERLLRALNAA